MIKINYGRGELRIDIFFFEIHSYDANVFVPFGHRKHSLNVLHKSSCVECRQFLTSFMAMANRWTHRFPFRLLNALKWMEKSINESISQPDFATHSTSDNTVRVECAVIRNLLSTNGKCVKIANTKNIHSVQVLQRYTLQINGRLIVDIVSISICHLRLIHLIHSQCSIEIWTNDIINVDTIAVNFFQPKKGDQLSRQFVSLQLLNAIPPNSIDFQHSIPSSD